MFDVRNPKDEDFSEKFLARVVEEVEERLGNHLDSESLVEIKALIRRPGREALDRQGVEEVIGRVAEVSQGRVAGGVSQGGEWGEET